MSIGKQIILLLFFSLCYSSEGSEDAEWFLFEATFSSKVVGEKKKKLQGQFFSSLIKDKKNSNIDLFFSSGKLYILVSLADTPYLLINHVSPFQGELRYRHYVGLRAIASGSRLEMIREYGRIVNKDLSK